MLIPRGCVVARIVVSGSTPKIMGSRSSRRTTTFGSSPSLRSASAAEAHNAPYAAIFPAKGMVRSRVRSVTYLGRVTAGSPISAHSPSLPFHRSRSNYDFPFLRCRIARSPDSRLSGNWKTDPRNRSGRRGHSPVDRLGCGSGGLLSEGWIG